MDLVAALQASRALTVEHEGMQFMLSVPTEFALRRLYRKHSPDGALDLDAVQRAAVLEGLTGWQGVTARRVLGQAATVSAGGEVQPNETDAHEALAFDPGVAAAWLDADIRLHDALALAMWERLGRLRASREGDAKN